MKYFYFNQGPFFNVYACKQPWLDYNLFFCPDQRPDDGKLWLVMMMVMMIVITSFIVR